MEIFTRSTQIEQKLVTVAGRQVNLDKLGDLATVIETKENAV